MRALLGVGCLVLVLLSGCEASVVEGLSEGEALRASVVLERHGIGARVESARGGGGRSIVVFEGDVGRARAILAAHRVLGEEGEVEPSEGLLGPGPGESHRREERERGRALAVSLRRWAGVEDARVHLVLPRRGWTLEGTPGVEGGQASVWVRGEGVDREAVSRFVASALPGVVLERVTVEVEVGGAVEVGEVVLERVGPWSVSPGSASSLRWVLVGLIGGVVVMTLVGGVWVVRGRRRRRAG